jgi:hypothetical protein
LNNREGISWLPRSVQACGPLPPGRPEDNNGRVLKADRKRAQRSPIGVAEKDLFRRSSKRYLEND